MNDQINFIKSELAECSESESAEYLRRQAAKWKIDWERLDAAIDRYQIDNCTSYGEATAAIVGRLEAHQYPEPRRAPTCGNCFQPKNKHLPQCRLGPDASGWTDRALSAEELIAEGIDPKEADVPEEKSEEPKEPGWYSLPPCSCGSTRIRTNSVRGSVNCDDCGRFLVGVHTATRRDLIAKAWAEGKGKPQSAYYVGSDPTWKNPGPCTCGSNSLGMDKPLAKICCNDCRRQVDAEYNSWKNDKLLCRRSVLKAWTEGKGERGKVYYVARGPSWDNPGPCCCGEKDNLFWDSQHRSQIGCNVCGRTVTYHAPWNPDRAPALILRAWAEGKGKGGKYYYAAAGHEAHQTTISADHRGTVDGDSPACGCGEQPTWDSVVAQNEFRLVCARLGCFQSTAFHSSKSAARERWIEIRLSPLE